MTHLLPPYHASSSHAWPSLFRSYGLGDAWRYRSWGSSRGSGRARGRAGHRSLARNSFLMPMCSAGLPLTRRAFS